MKYEIGKNCMYRNNISPKFHIIKAVDDSGNTKYYEGYSVLYNYYNKLIDGKKSDKKCSSLNGDIIERSPIYKTNSADSCNYTLTQFIYGVKMETTFSVNLINELTEYTRFSPESLYEFIQLLSTGKNYLNVPIADLFCKSSNGGMLIGVKYADEYKAIQNDEDNHNNYKRIHRFMSDAGICYYLIMNIDGIFVPFLLREFDPMA